MQKSTTTSADITKSLYRNKVDHYFTGIRHDWIAQLRILPADRVLEVGCGAGGTGNELLSTGISKYVAGIEFSSGAAAIAKTRLTQVLDGNIEHMSLPWGDEYFDVALISEVLEHLVEPKATLIKVHACLKRGGVVFASSPNVSHHHVIWSLLRGRWDLRDSGVMDRTHLRWFTPASYKALFEEAGFRVEQLGPVCRFSRKTALLNRLTGNRLSHLFMSQVQVRAVKL